MSVCGEHAPHCVAAQAAVVQSLVERATEREAGN